MNINVKSENIYFYDIKPMSIHYLDTPLGHEIYKKEKLNLLLNLFGDKFGITIDDIKEHLISDNLEKIFPNVSEITYKQLILTVDKIASQMRKDEER